MGNAENIDIIQRKKSIPLKEEENHKEDDKIYSRRSSVKMKSFNLNKEQYHGQTFGGLKEGYGVCYYKNGDKYDGNWKENKREGKGVFFHNETGEVYKGNFSNNKPNGMGIYYYKNGDRYEGMFKDGKKHGEGTIFFKNGGRYKGEFKNNLKHGKGEYKNQFGQNKYEYWDNGVLKTNYDNDLINNNESNNLFNETNTKRFDEFLKGTYRKKSFEKMPLLNKIKNIKEKTKNKLNDQQLVQILNTVKEKPNIKNWTVDDVKMLFEKINLEKYIPNIESNSVDGKKLLFLDNSSISNIFKLNDKNEIKIITTLIEFIGDISNNEQDKNKIDINTNTNSNIINNNNNKKSNNINNLIINKNSNKPEDVEVKEIINNNNNNLQKNNNIQKKEEENEKNSSSGSSSSSLSSNSSNSNSFSSTKNKKGINNKEMNKLGKSEFYSSLNNNSLNFFINYDEIKKEIKIGEGGMGRIYNAEWQGKQVALKKVKLNYNEKENIQRIKKFINEINIIASMRHPNIVLYMGTTIDKNNVCLITEYLPKGSLYNYLYIDKKQFTEKQKINIALQMAIGIQYIHSRKILHCDLKSSNVLLDENFKIKLSDFGLSYVMTEIPKGITFGTYRWMAPEILNDGKYEIASDIFSYGMILWELLTGTVPYCNIFKNDIIIDKKSIKNYVNMKFENNEEIIPLPKDGNITLRYITSKCLQYRPQDRLSLDEIIKHLSKVNKCYEEFDETIFEMYNFVC